MQSRWHFPRLRLLPTAAVCLVVFFTYFISFDFYTRYSRRTSISDVSDPLLPSNTYDTSIKILLVSALFPLPQSKHTHEEYRSWLSNFLSRISTSDIYFYTTPDLESLVRDLHANANTTTSLTINTDYSSPLLVPPLLPYKDKYAQMHEWDREKSRHSPELYAVWNAKPWFLDSAVQKAGHEYDYAFWVDAGSFRHEHAYGRWPDARRVDEVWEQAYRLSRKDGLRGKGDLMLIPAFELPGRAEIGWSKEHGPVDIDFSEGTFFGSTPATISWYATVFYRYHNRYISTTPSALASPRHPHGPPLATPPPFHFVGKDQTLINALLFLYPHRFFTIVAPQHHGLLPPPTSSSSTTTTTPAIKKPFYIGARFRTLFRARLFDKLRGKNGPCGDEWFYFQYWLASPSERRRMSSELWPSRPGKAVRWVESWVRGRAEERCGLTDVVTVEGMLRALFGGRWVERVRAWGE